MNSNLNLHKAIFKGNYPVAEAYIIYYTPSGLNAPFDAHAHAKALAADRGFINPDPLEIKLLGKFRPVREYPSGIVSYENGEY